MSRKGQGQAHGGSREPLYRVWNGMRQRCTNPNHRSFPAYGGRGISVCLAWDDYANFRAWAHEHGWVPGLDVDRVDNDGDYSPGNCQVSTRRQNLLNTSRNHQLTAWGETKPLTAWAEDERCVVVRAALATRIRLGWSTEDALVTPHGHWNPQRPARALAKIV